MALRLLFVGPPGSGKGTQAQRLRARGILHASSGDMLRAEIEAGTERGRRIAEVVRSGGLVADEWVNEIVARFLQAHPRQALVLDGYPRNLAQARRLAELIAVDAAVFFEIDDETLVRRLHDRVIGLDGAIYDLTFAPPPPGVTWRRREDDAPEITRHRLALYRAREAELRAFYQSAGLYRPLAAALSPDAIAAQLNAIVDDLAARGGGQPADR
ncbi:MAG TPA: nucleoside monophosphate kinase [Terriglobales bacterium]|nr:nucleoside monophosphate kinase [Terriglobales bacterium]